MAVWNNPTVSGVEKHAKNWLGGFKAFILRGNVVDLAIGIVIGAAFTAVVNGLVSDIITPLIPVSTGSLSDLTWIPPYSHSPVKFGAFINVVITFLISGFRAILLHHASSEYADGTLQAKGSTGASRYS